MSYHRPVSLHYNGIKILSVINDYKIPGARACSQEEVNNINDILNLKYRAYAMLYFSLPPRRIGLIHIDEDLLTDQQSPFKFALNLPLLNSHNIKMNWWEKKHSSIKDEYVNNGVGDATYKILQLENATCIDSVFYNQSILVDIYNYHNVENPTDNFAHFISLRFDDAVTKEMLIKDLS